MTDYPGLQLKSSARRKGVQDCCTLVPLTIASFSRKDLFEYMSWMNYITKEHSKERSHDHIEQEFPTVRPSNFLLTRLYSTVLFWSMHLIQSVRAGK